MYFPKQIRIFTEFYSYLTNHIIMSLRKITISAIASIATTVFCFAQNPVWLETDSAEAINSRINRDFPYTVSEIKQKIDFLDNKTIDKYIKKGYIETKKLGGKKMVHRKAASNVKLLAPELSGFNGRGADAGAEDMKLVSDIVYNSNGDGSLSQGQRITYKFTIDVPTVDAIKGDTLKVWIPVPVLSDRQKNVRILSTYPNDYVLSTLDRSVHNTAYFVQPVGEKNTHFECVVQYDVYAQYFSPHYILNNLKPYDKNSELYKKYTAFEAPHIVKLKEFAQNIVGNEKNPYRCSELIFDYISKTYPWAGALEYSTIPCIPEYVIKSGHGDCGQVALLYISLMRSLGIPARWESGWMLHPGQVNLHDWAEVYFEGIGWVPVDASFGRYTSSEDNEVRHFYSTGLDQWRLAANKGVCGKFFPAKKYVRSETVDSQVGEVECSKGNLFYPGWNQNFEILSIEPVSGNQDVDPQTIVDEVKETVAPDKRQVVFEITAEKKGNDVILAGNTSEETAKDAVIAAFARRGISVIDSINCYPTNKWALVKLSVCCLRTQPKLSAEMATQSIMGQPIRLLEKLPNGWWRAQTPDGYIGYLSSSSIEEKSEERMDAWRKAERVIVTSVNQTDIYRTAKSKSPRDIISDAVLGDILVGRYDPKSEMTLVTLPDGRKGYIATSDIMSFSKWVKQPFDAQKILDTAYSMEGTYYLWGGTSIKACDCSGLAKIGYFSNGIILMRDASQQVHTGKNLGTDWKTFQPGDLLFFGNKETGKITHVAIHDKNGDYVHSSGRVKRNSLNPESPIYGAHSFITAVRIKGCIPSQGITRVEDHPWFFDK